MRRPIKKRHVAKPETIYQSVNVAKLINYIMKDGKKTAARKVVYGALTDIKGRADGIDPLEVLETALRNVGPTVEVRSRRVGGANYQVPREVRPERRIALSYRWLIDAARHKKGSPMAKRLADELFAASKNEGEAVKKRENVHKMADANKAFAHFAW
jgi:small subunit ribosomal protein S7